MTMPPSPSVSARAQTLAWMTHPYDFLAQCRDELGDVFTIDFREHGQYVLLSHPEHIHQVLVGDPAVYRGANTLLEPFLGRHSLLLLEAEAHRRERRLLMPHFSRRQIHGYGAQIAAVADELIDAWAEGDTLSMREEGQRVALALIDRLVFGLDADQKRHRALHECFDAILGHRHFNIALIGQFGEQIGASASWQQLQEQLQRMDELIRAEIADRRASGRRGGDIMSLLMEAEHDDGRPMSDDELRDELVTLLATGHETTATSLAWVVYWVLSHPEVHRRLRDELAGLPADAAPEQVAALPYLEAVVCEALRIHPVVPVVARQLQAPVELGGYELPAGVTVAPVIYLLHQREDLYPAPGEFRPERFLERDFAHNEYMPFGGGVRRCLGMHLAMYELAVLAARIVSRVDLRLVDERPARPVRRMVTIAPSGGARVRVDAIRE